LRGTSRFGFAGVLAGGGAAKFFSGPNEAVGGTRACCLGGLARLESHGASSPQWRILCVVAALAL